MAASSKKTMGKAGFEFPIEFATEKKISDGTKSVSLSGLKITMASITRLGGPRISSKR